MSKNTLAKEVREALEDVCAFRFQQLLRVVPTLVPSIDVEEYKDRYILLDVILNNLMDGSSAQRLAARCLLYIKQHVSFLRHQQESKSLRVKNCVIIIGNFCDLTQALIDLQADKCLEVVKNMIIDYYRVCVEHNIRLGDIRPPLTDILGINTESQTGPVLAPPKEQTMEWYKTHGWRPFFGPGQTIVFLAGRFANQPCVIDFINGNNVRCIFNDGSHCISAAIPFTWED